MSAHQDPHPPPLPNEGAPAIPPPEHANGRASEGGDGPVHPSPDSNGAANDDAFWASQISSDCASTLEKRLHAAQAEGLEANLLRQLAFIGAKSGDVVEFQALKVKSGRFHNSYSAFVTSSAAAIDGCNQAVVAAAQGIYLISAKLRAGVESRAAPDLWHPMLEGESTTDSDIACRTLLPIDLDVQRPRNTSATEEEMLKSVDVALKCWSYLEPIVGEEALAYVHSGNGRRIHVPLAFIDESKEAHDLIKEIFVHLDTLFSTDEVKVDKKLFDAKRILPAAGTIKRKGRPNDAARPHRRTAILTPSKPRRLTVDDLRALVERLRVDAGAAAPKAAGGNERSRASEPKRSDSAPKTNDETNPWKRVNALDSHQVAAWLGVLEGRAVRCPGCSETSGVDIVERGLKCHHNRCADKGKNGFRSNVDLTMEVRGIDKTDAYGLLAAQFGLDPLPQRLQRQQSRSSGERSQVPTKPVPDKQGDRPAIVIQPDIHVVVEEAVSALRADPGLYTRTGRLVHVVPISFEEAESGGGLKAGTPIIRDMPREIVQLRLSRHARFVHWDGGSEDWQPCAPPEHIARKVHALGEWDGLRALLGIVESPIMLSDGSILQTPGYHGGTGLLYAPSCVFPSVPDAPTLDDARAALARLSFLYVDFPFESDAQRLVPIANAMTILCRPAIRGHVPGFLYDAPAPGSGKSLLTDAVSIQCSGRECPRSSYPIERGETNNTEMVKLLTGYAATGLPFFSFDNIPPNTPIGGGALDQAMTARFVQFRQLGQTRQNDTYRWIAVVMATGNNPSFSDDGAARRWLHGRLVPLEEEPDRRDPSKFTVQPNLPDYVRVNRAQLVVDLLTIVRSYVVAGRPKQQVIHWGSFDAWSALVASALAWCSGIDVTTARAVPSASPQTGALVRFLHEFRASFGSRELLAREIVRLAYEDARIGRDAATRERLIRLVAAMEELSPPPPRADQTDERRLGKALARYKERVVEGGLRLMASYDEHTKAQRWRVENVKTGAARPTHDDPFS